MLYCKQVYLLVCSSFYGARIFHMTLLDLSFTNLKPPLISMGNGSIQDIVDIIESQALTTSEKMVLKGIKLAIDSHGESYVNAEMIGARLSRNEETVRQILKTLTKKGLFREEGCRTHPTKVRRSSVFIFNDSYTTTMSLPPAFSQGTLEVGSNTDFTFPKDTQEKGYGLSDNLICKYFFAALQYSHKQKSDKIETRVYIDGEPIRVTAIARKGQRVAFIRDLRYYISILRLAERIMADRINAVAGGFLKEAELKSTLFDINESDILTNMGLGTGSGERENMNRAISRLEGTTYFIDSAPSFVMDKLGLAQYELKIDHFTIREYMKSKDGRVLYRLELDQKTVDKIYQYVSANKRFFEKADPRIMTELNALKFAFLLWSLHQKPGAITSFSWETLKDSIAPKYKMTDFKEGLSLLMSRNLQKMEKKHVLPIDWESNKKVVRKCLSEFNDISIIYTLEKGFYIQRKSTNQLTMDTLNG